MMEEGRNHGCAMALTRWFETEPDGSFTIDVAAFEAAKAA